MARSNSFEGGSNGVTVSTGNSGGASGDAFDSVSVGTGAVVAYSTAQAAHGSVSMTTSTTGTSSLAYAAYTLASVTGDFARSYFRFASLPSAATQPIMRYMSGAAQALRVNVKSGGALELRDAGNSVVATTTAVITAGQFWRGEIQPVFSTTVGAITFRLYLSPDSATPTETLTPTGLTLTANASEFRLGIGSAMASAVQVFYDDPAVEGATWHGPALRSITPSGIAVPVALGATALAQSMAITPLGIAVPVALGAAALAQDMAITPAGIAVPVGLGTPALAQAMAITPSGIAVPVGLGNPSVAFAEPPPVGVLTASPPRLGWRAHVPDTGWHAGTPVDRWQVGPVQGGE